MSIRPFLLPLIAAGMLSLASAGAWAQDSGRGHDRGQAGQGDRGGRGDAMRDAPRQRPMMGEARLPPEPRQQEARRQRRDDEMADSVRRIERSTRGRVINAERVQSDGRDVNRIKVMDERGRIRVYMDDPQQRNRPPTRDDDN